MLDTVTVEQVDGCITVFDGGKPVAEILGTAGLLNGLSDYLRKNL